MYPIDLNCDLGESYGAFRVGIDEEIMKYITSANIACGFHGGDPTTMHRTVNLCIDNNVVIGAHPGLPDLLGFGRREIAITPEEAYDMVLYQIGALSAFVKSEGGELKHVKPHGALYHMTVDDQVMAQAVAEAIFRVDPKLIVYGLSKSKLIEAGKSLGLHCANEAFADRTYSEEGFLTLRNMPKAVIVDIDEAVSQAISIVKYQKVSSISGTEVGVIADTLCLHGDGPHALAFAKKISERFKLEGITIQALK